MIVKSTITSGMVNNISLEFQCKINDPPGYEYYLRKRKAWMRLKPRSLLLQCAVSWAIGPEGFRPFSHLPLVTVRIIYSTLSFTVHWNCFNPQLKYMNFMYWLHHINISRLREGPPHALTDFGGKISKPRYVGPSATSGRKKLIHIS